MHEQYLMHWGIKGMKWGVRRYQNEDGTYTSAGRRRRKEVNYHEDYRRTHDNKPVSKMSNKELQERNQRLQMEQQYQNLTKKKTYEKGKKIVKEILWASGAIAGLAAAYKKNKAIVDNFIDSNVMTLPVFFNDK